MFRVCTMVLLRFSLLGCFCVFLFFCISLCAVTFSNFLCCHCFQQSLCFFGLHWVITTSLPLSPAMGVVLPRCFSKRHCACRRGVSDVFLKHFMRPSSIWYICFDSFSDFFLFVLRGDFVPLFFWTFLKQFFFTLWISPFMGSRVTLGAFSWASKFVMRSVCRLSPGAMLTSPIFFSSCFPFSLCAVFVCVSFSRRAIACYLVCFWFAASCDCGRSGPH